METQSQGGTGKIVTAFIIGLIIGFAGGVFWQERRGEALPADEVAEAATEDIVEKKVAETSATNKNIAGTAAGTAALASKAVLVMDQQAGTNVAVAQVVTDETVWVAVREEAQGVLRNILGVQKVIAGEHKAVSVELLRGTQAGKSYAVVLYRDVGAPAFNYREDMLVDGVADLFTATGGANAGILPSVLMQVEAQ